MELNFSVDVPILISSSFQCILAAAFASFSLLYWTCGAFRFHLRLALYYMYFICAALLMLPAMLWNGRSRKNMWWCSFSQWISEWLFGLHSKVMSPENLITDGPSVIVSNHQCALDVTGMGKLFSERSTCLAKKELLYAGPFGLGIWLSGFVFIERSKKRESRDVLSKIAKEVNKDGLCVWIFPEGTRNPSDEMLTFKKGAFNLAVEAQVPIVPVVFSSYKKFFNPKLNVFNRGNYVIQVLTPVSTKNLSVEDVPMLANDVRSRMMSAFKKISEKSY